jgi:Pyridoxamine 5'-phosphate oxidase
MNDLKDVAPAFVEMAHRIVWCTASTVDAQGRPRSRILHPFWQWDGSRLVGWIATSPTPLKRAHLQASPHISINYWSPSQDTCLAECKATWILDDEGRTKVWNLFLNAPPPVGYNPTIVAVWPSPTSEAFAALRLEPWRLRVFPGTAFFGKGGQLLKWRESDR